MSREKCKARLLYLLMGIIIPVGILFIYKYYNFFIGIISSDLILHSLILPAGISFYTFQSIGYVIDVYRKEYKAEKNFIDYSLFICYFPQLIAGPIEKAECLIPQLKNSIEYNDKMVTEGFCRIIIGFCKKIFIADTLSKLVNPVFDNITQFSGYEIIFASICFAFEIYYDFSAYSDIAIGVSGTLGIRLTENFDKPYKAKSVSEFWSRWHITLNRWLRNYIYIPLGGNRKGIVFTLFNILIVFVISGLWHGARFNYIIWGLFNGLIVCLEKLYIKKINKTKKLYRLISYVLIIFGWLIFRLQSFNDISYIIQNINSIWYFNNPLFLFNQTNLTIINAIAFIIGILIIKVIKSKTKLNFLLLLIIIEIIALYWIYQVKMESINAFIYFRF